MEMAVLIFFEVLCKLDFQTFSANLLTEKVMFVCYSIHHYLIEFEQQTLNETWYRSSNEYTPTFLRIF